MMDKINAEKKESTLPKRIYKRIQKNKIKLTRNELRFLLICNDLHKIYKIFYNFRLPRPFLIIGSKTAQTITNLPIFLSFCFMSLSVLQFSIQRPKNSNNCPGLAITYQKIPQKLETLYHQLNPIKIYKHHQNIKSEGTCGNLIAEAREALPRKSPLTVSAPAHQITNLNELKKDQNSILERRLLPYPIDFHNIVEPYQQDIINLFKTFEQIPPILISEIEEEQWEWEWEWEDDDDTDTDGAEAYYFYEAPPINSIDLSSELLGFPIEITDLQNSKALKIISQFLRQYQNYLKKQNAVGLDEEQLGPTLSLSQVVRNFQYSPFWKEFFHSHFWTWGASTGLNFKQWLFLGEAPQTFPLESEYSGIYRGEPEGNLLAERASLLTSKNTFPLDWTKKFMDKFSVRESEHWYWQELFYQVQQIHDLIPFKIEMLDKEKWAELHRAALRPSGWARATPQPCDSPEDRPREDWQSQQLESNVSSSPIFRSSYTEPEDFLLRMIINLLKINFPDEYKNTGQYNLDLDILEKEENQFRIYNKYYEYLDNKYLDCQKELFLGLVKNPLLQDKEKQSQRLKKEPLLITSYMLDFFKYRKLLFKEKKVESQNMNRHHSTPGLLEGRHSRAVAHLGLDQVAANLTAKLRQKVQKVASRFRVGQPSGGCDNAELRPAISHSRNRESGRKTQNFFYDVRDMQQRYRKYILSTLRLRNIFKEIYLSILPVQKVVSWKQINFEAIPVVSLKKKNIFNTRTYRDIVDYQIINTPINFSKKKKIEKFDRIMKLLSIVKNRGSALEAFGDFGSNRLSDQFFVYNEKQGYINLDSNELEYSKIYIKNRQHFCQIVDEIKYNLALSIRHQFDIGSVPLYLRSRSRSMQSQIQTMPHRKMSGYVFPDQTKVQFHNFFVHLDFENFIKGLKWKSPTQSKNLYPATLTLKDFKEEYSKIFKKIFNLKLEDEEQYAEIRENITYYSWSLVFFGSTGWIFSNIFKNAYKKYGKEIVEYGIDFLNKAGIFDDEECLWIKQELGMTPGQAFRGIRHQLEGKKCKNIIGLDNESVMLQVTEMVWFLKTKQLIKSNESDPLIKMVVLANNPIKKMYLQSQQVPIQVMNPKRVPWTWKWNYHLDTYPTDGSPIRPFDRDVWKAKEGDIFPSENSDSVKAKRFKKFPKPEICFTSLYLKPKGFLFIGPPGTGKTLLVQAIAGESGVPVVTQAGGVIKNPLIRGKGIKILNKLFNRAREISPCIIFIDEIDGIGARRQYLPADIDIRGHYDPVGFMEDNDNINFEEPQKPKLQIQRKPGFYDDHDVYWEEPEFTQTLQLYQIPIDVLQEIEFSRLVREEQIGLLTKLLIELDGVQSLDNILVIGATNRLEILDPALMRPGRLQRILKFNLPDYNARKKLLKLYTQASRIGVENISWDYFSKRTYGLSCADISSIVFASELIAVEQCEAPSKRHTFETLERGIDLITSFPSDPVMFRLRNIFIFLDNSIQDFFYKNYLYQGFQEEYWEKSKTMGTLQLQEISNILRNSYYNIGKMLILFCLELMPLAFIALWERPQNFRFLFFAKNLNFNEFKFHEFDEKRFSRIHIEKRLLSFFGGKAGESLFIFLPFQKFSSEICFQFDKIFLSFANSLEQSNYGIESEIQNAQNLLKLMVEKWYLYMENISTDKFHPILENTNLSEYSEFGQQREMFINQAIADEMEIDLDMRHRLSKNQQKHSYPAWWMKKVTSRLNFVGIKGTPDLQYEFLQWSRIYLSDPENYTPNIEWVPPDEYYHTLLRTPPDCMSWTQFLENGRAMVANLLLLKSFNTVFKTLRQFSEFMDFLSDYLFRYECLRDPEFRSKIEKFFDLYISHGATQKVAMRESSPVFSKRSNDDP
uniref:Cell division protein FTSH n=1 Tax=Rhipiliopsis peltata TaxID=2320810 RepID=A0A386B164_9CHLO|nr:Cell division protein FTSH [Rhipiliopsis peltata]AYC65435.1 Cell division protein FTSH [Rhipiliopsis peltata]